MKNEIRDLHNKQSNESCKSIRIPPVLHYILQLAVCTDRVADVCVHRQCGWCLCEQTVWLMSVWTSITPVLSCRVTSLCYSPCQWTPSKKTPSPIVSFNIAWQLKCCLPLHLPQSSVISQIKMYVFFSSKLNNTFAETDYCVKVVGPLRW